MKKFTILFFLIPILGCSQGTLKGYEGNIPAHEEYYKYEDKARSNFFIYPDSTIYYAKICHDIAIKDDNIYGIVAAQIIIGLGYYIKGNYADAADILLDNLKIVETLKDSKIKQNILLEIYDGLGCIYCESGIFKEGQYYLNNAKNNSYQLQNNPGILNELSSIGIYYEQNNEIDSAEYYLKKSLIFSDEIKNRYYTVSILNSLGNCEKKRGHLSAAVGWWIQATKYPFEDNSNKSLAYNNLGRFYLEKGAYDSSYIYLKKGVEASTKVNNLKTLYQANDLLLTLFKKTNKVDSIHRYLNLCYNLRDTVDKVEKAKHVQSVYLNEQLRQQSLVELNLKYKNTLQNALFALIIGIFILISLFQYRNIRHKQKAKIEIENAYGELKATQAQLIQSEKMASLGELTAGIAHEIQNPLNFVNNYSEVNVELMEELTEELENGNVEEAKFIVKDLTDNQTKIHHHGQRADAIVRGMLQHSRIHSGTKEPTNLNQLADEYLRLAYQSIKAIDKSIETEYSTDFDQNLPLIKVVPQDIGRVVLNIINNAFQACAERSKSMIDSNGLSKGSGYKPLVKVSTKKLDNAVEIRIKDNGNGIPEAIRDKIFQPFFTTKPTGQGTGLGLSLAYDSVKAHGGTLEVVSAEGEGSTFILTLPLSTPSL